MRIQEVSSERNIQVQIECCCRQLILVFFKNIWYTVNLLSLSKDAQNGDFNIVQMLKQEKEEVA